MHYSEFLPVTVAFMLMMLLITHILLKYSKFGRYLYAIGGNADAAAAAGIQVKRVKWAVYIISGIFAAIAGMVMMGRLNAGMPGEGRGFETDAITSNSYRLGDYRSPQQHNESGWC